MNKIHLLHPCIAEITHLITTSVIGVGGTGSHVLTNLAMINHSLKALHRPGLHVVAIDPDVVTESNIGRQVFSPSDIGRNKAEVLIERINRYYGLSWQAHDYKYDHGVHSSNIIISCVDNIRTRKNIGSNLEYKTGSMYSSTSICYYWMDIGNDRRMGQVILGTRNENDISRSPRKNQPGTEMHLPDFCDQFKGTRSKPNQPSCSVAEALFKQDLFINKILATYACQMLWQLLKDYNIAYRGLYVNLETMKASPIPIE